MKNYSFEAVDLKSGFLFDKQELNRKTTINAVLRQFTETGRIDAFRFDYREGNGTVKPHFYWDSDVAKWMEGAAYILQKHPDTALEAKLDEIVAQIKQHQGQDGYFNIYHTVVAPELRWKDRNHHELYCAGHLIEAAIAYHEATGKRDFLDCMERYADYIEQVFIKEKSAAFNTPGHEEIELALLRLFRHTGKRKYLDMAAHFINTRGTVTEPSMMTPHTQSHLPVREQREAVGHAVRACYLYTAMAMLAKETGDTELAEICQTLFLDIVKRKMYITGGIGAAYAGEAFSIPFDLPNATAYAETCAAISLLYFAAAMQELDENALYADVIERLLYNGILSGLSLDGKSFFYINPLEIDLAARCPQNAYGEPVKLSLTERVPHFKCSCCPPNLNRLLSSLGNYVYGVEGDTLFVHQFATSTLSHGAITCEMQTNYPTNGIVNIKANGVSRLAVRIPSWCEHFTLNVPYEMKNGYAIANATELTLAMTITPRTVFADTRVSHCRGKAAVMRGPVVYCAEGIDNGAALGAICLPRDPVFKEGFDTQLGVPTLELDAERHTARAELLYTTAAPLREPVTLKMIPYRAFANRGATDMTVWLKTL